MTSDLEPGILTQLVVWHHRHDAQVFLHETMVPTPEVRDVYWVSPPKFFNFICFSGCRSTKGIIALYQCCLKICPNLKWAILSYFRLVKLDNMQFMIELLV